MGLVATLGFMVLPLSALIARRQQWPLMAKAAAGWAAIFLMIGIVVGYRQEIGSFFGDLGARLGLSSPQMTDGVLRIPVSDDGHYWVTARVNGRDHRMMIDSGATYTALSADSASALGVKIDAERAEVLNTANGPVTAQVGTIDDFAVGPLQTRNLDVVVSASFGDTDVVGMNFLSRLGRWKVEQGVLVLETGGD